MFLSKIQRILRVRVTHLNEVLTSKRKEPIYGYSAKSCPFMRKRHSFMKQLRRHIDRVIVHILRGY